MPRKLWPLALVLVGCLTFLLPASVSAKSMTPMNLYGGVAVSIPATCPNKTTVVTLQNDGSYYSITVSGQTQGSMRLSDTNGSFTKTVSGTSSYSFTATRSDNFQACMTNGGKGTVTFAGQLNQYSGNYAGYGVNGFNANPNVYSIIVGSWTVPTISCNFAVREMSHTATWLGFGGLPNTGSNNMLEQEGVDEQCYNGFPHYNAVTEMVPSDSSFVVLPYGCSDSNQSSCSHVAPAVKPSDNINAKITYAGNGNFLMQLYDLNQHWYSNFTRSQSGSSQSTARYTAEWIQEQAGASLANFGQVNFSGCSVDGSAIRNGGPIVEQYIIKPNGSSAVKAQPLGLTGNGSNFSVLFENH